MASARRLVGGVALVYLWAFASLFVQLPALYHHDGVAPLSDEVVRARSRLEAAAGGAAGPSELAAGVPGLWWWLPSRGVPDRAIDAACAGGMLAALLALLAVRLAPRPRGLAFAAAAAPMAVAWAVYLSFVNFGGTFMSFQWDVLLLEAGAVAALAPLAPRAGVWAARWLLVRLMFMSGVVKLTSACPEWWGLTALHSHFETTCLPAAASWYAHQLPALGLGGALRLGTAATFYIEIVAPFFLLVPWLPTLRRAGVALQVVLQVLIAATGNYNFFNALTLVLCAAVADARPRKAAACPRAERAASLAVLAASLAWAASLARWDAAAPAALAFGQPEFERWLGVVAPAALLAALAGTAVAVARTLAGALLRPGPPLLRPARAAVSGAAAVALAALVVLSTAHLADLTPGGLEVPPQMARARAAAAPFHLSPGYGLFRRMTTSRREVVLELRDAAGAWHEARLPYQPGDASRAPAWIVPHQPRLDWQMWFAALGDFRHNPWLIHTAVKLLLGAPGVAASFEAAPGAPDGLLRGGATAVRAVAREYHFTAAGSGEAAAGQWWVRGEPERYLPEIEARSEGLAGLARQMGWHKTAGDLEAGRALPSRAGPAPALDALRAALATVVDCPWAAALASWALWRLSVGASRAPHAAVAARAAAAAAAAGAKLKAD